MKASELVANAWYLSGIVARDLETVSGSQATDGLRLLNDLLSEKRITGRLIPYFTQTSFNAVVGQESYFVNDLIETEDVTFNIGDVRYPLIRANRRRYFGDGRVDNIDSLPYQYFPERELGGTRIYFYFKPADTYEIRVTGKFALSNVTNDTVIDNELEPFYISYLNYALADRMCDFYSLPLGDAKKKRLYDFERILSDLSGLDTTVKKRSILGKGQTTAYGQANLGRGWTIPS